MQLQDIQDAVRERMGFTDADAMATDAQMTEFINAAIRRVQIMHDWPWLEASEDITAVVDTDEYTPNAAWRTTLSVSINDIDLVYRSPRDITRYNQYNGHPVMFSIREGKLVVAPAPQQAYTIKHRYITTETALSNATDEPLVPDWAIDLVIVIAAKMLATRIRDSGMQQLLSEEHRDILRYIQDEVRRARPLPIPKHRTDWNQ